MRSLWSVYENLIALERVYVREFKNYDHKLIISGLLFSVIITVAINFLYPHLVTRWIVITVYAIIVVCVFYKHKNEILVFLRKDKKLNV